jgi:hypothetical protein
LIRPRRSAIHDAYQDDADPPAVVEAWPTLPEALKAAIMAIVRSAM